jgi:hypothetical protein
MATGDTTDMAARLKRLLPPWFGESNPLVNALIAAAAAVLAFAYSLFAYAQAQARIRTATGIWLDIVAQDFFGSRIVRSSGQSDDSFRALILANLLRPRATRQAISDVVQALTAFAPQIIEPFRPVDCGAYSVGYACYGGAGAYGSVSLPAQAFLVADRPRQPGIAIVAGYGASTAGYGVGSQAEYASLDMLGARVTDDQIYGTIAEAKAAGVTIWTRIKNHKGVDDVTINGAPFTFSGQPINLS